MMMNGFTGLQAGEKSATLQAHIPVSRLYQWCTTVRILNQLGCEIYFYGWGLHLCVGAGNSAQKHRS